MRGASLLQPEKIYLEIEKDYEINQRFHPRRTTTSLMTEDALSILGRGQSVIFKVFFKYFIKLRTTIQSRPGSLLILVVFPLIIRRTVALRSKKRPARWPRRKTRQIKRAAPSALRPQPNPGIRHGPSRRPL